MVDVGDYAYVPNELLVAHQSENFGDLLEPRHVFTRLDSF
jgi:hypothetical protein